MTDGGYVSTTPPIKHDDEKPSVLKLIWPKLLAILIIALILLLISLVQRSSKKCIDTTEEEIQVMILDKSSYSYGKAEYCSCDDYYYFNPNTAETELSVLIEYNGEQYMVHNILLHSKAKVGEYFDAVLVTDLYSDGSVRQQIRFDLGGNHEDK